MDNVNITLAGARGLHGRSVRAGIRLGHSNTALEFASGDPRQPPLLLLFVASMRYLMGAAVAHGIAKAV